MKPIISIKKLGKQYRIATPKTHRATLREAFADAIRKPLTHFKENRRSSSGTFWALKDVSFDVYPGEVIGIVGSNGAGKSTLLKILSRIVSPTTGRIELYGRIGSLLEVGTGFHPELTGRENIFLNGSILGMSRGEIERKFDEIVAFADIDQFIDTPVKRYSSGMYVRLAFAVAAHLEPEILIVDEVLAVGDANFQKKCLRKMGEASKEGRTVLFVSHNLAAIQRLCDHCVILRSGIADQKLPTNEAVAAYMQQISATSNLEANLTETQTLRVKNFGFAKADSDVFSYRFNTDEEFDFSLRYELISELENVYVAIWFLTTEGLVFMSSFDVDTYPSLHKLRPAGEYNSRVKIPPGYLNAGEYTVRVLVYVHHGEVYFDDSSLFIQIVDTGEESANVGWGHRVGQIVPRFNWDVKWNNKPV